MQLYSLNKILLKSSITHVKDKKDKIEIYQACREGLKKSGLVITEDSRLVILSYLSWEFNNLILLYIYYLLLSAKPETLLKKSYCIRVTLLFTGRGWGRGMAISAIFNCNNLRSRLAGNKPKEVSTKLNFNSFLEHYQTYSGTHHSMS